ncbi:MAG: phospholipase D-like domain-containing protein [Thiohalomonadaceae bacterium]
MTPPFPLSRTRFPWRSGNHFTLLVDGGQFFPAMLAAIAEARHYILLEMYLVETGTITSEFISAFNAAAQRGVQVFLLLDDFGARGLMPSCRQRLSAAGIDLSFYNPLRYGNLRRNLLRDHRKMLVVDSTVAFIGGTGITDEFLPQDGEPWHEVMLAVYGPCVTDWQVSFKQVWHSVAATGRTALPDFPDQATQAVAHATGRVVLNAPLHMDIKRSLVNHLRSAEQRIWIATAYFIPSRKIRRLLKRSARQGLDVRLLLPGHITDHPAVRHAGRRYYDKLLLAGVRIFELQPRFQHSKVCLVDTWVSIGSSNIDRWNFSWNLEAEQEVEDHELAAQVAELFSQNFLQSHEYLLAEWQQRPWYRRLQERFWGTIELWLERFSQRKP